MATYPGRDSASVLRFVGFCAVFTAICAGYGLYRANETYEAGGDVNEIGIIVAIVVGVQAVLGAAFCFAIAASAENTAVLREEVGIVRDELKQAHAALARIEERTRAKVPS